MSPTELMEKDLKNLPNQLQVQLRKESSTLKTQESKLLASLKKMQKQHSTAKNKQALLTTKSKVKSSATLKKQLTAATQAYNKLDQALNEIMSQLKQTKDQGKVISAKKAKFAALAKQISSFDKEWVAKNPVLGDKPAAKPAKKLPRKQKSKASPTQEVVIQQEPLTSDLNMEVVE